MNENNNKTRQAGASVAAVDAVIYRQQQLQQQRRQQLQHSEMAQMRFGRGGHDGRQLPMIQQQQQQEQQQLFQQQQQQQNRLPRKNQNQQQQQLQLAYSANGVCGFIEPNMALTNRNRRRPPNCPPPPIPTETTLEQVKQQEPQQQSSSSATTATTKMKRPEPIYENVTKWDEQQEKKHRMLRHYFRNATFSDLPMYENLCHGCRYGVFESRGRLCIFCQVFVNGGLQLRRSQYELTKSANNNKTRTALTGPSSSSSPLPSSSSSSSSRNVDSRSNYKSQLGSTSSGQDNHIQIYKHSQSDEEENWYEDVNAIYERISSACKICFYDFENCKCNTPPAIPFRPPNHHSKTKHGYTSEDFLYDYQNGKFANQSKKENLNFTARILNKFSRSKSCEKIEENQYAVISKKLSSSSPPSPMPMPTAGTGAGAAAAETGVGVAAAGSNSDALSNSDSGGSSLKRKFTNIFGLRTQSKCRRAQMSSHDIIHNCEGYDKVFHTRDTFDLKKMCHLKETMKANKGSGEQLINLKPDYKYPPIYLGMSNFDLSKVPEPTASTTTNTLSKTKSKSHDFLMPDKLESKLENKINEKTKVDKTDKEEEKEKRDEKEEKDIFKRPRVSAIRILRSVSNAAYGKYKVKTIVRTASSPKDRKQPSASLSTSLTSLPEAQSSSTTTTTPPLTLASASKDSSIPAVASLPLPEPSTSSLSSSSSTTATTTPSLISTRIVNPILKPARSRKPTNVSFVLLDDIPIDCDENHKKYRTTPPPSKKRRNEKKSKYLKHIVNWINSLHSDVHPYESENINKVLEQEIKSVPTAAESYFYAQQGQMLQLAAELMEELPPKSLYANLLNENKCEKDLNKEKEQNAYRLSRSLVSIRVSKDQYNHLSVSKVLESNLDKKKLRRLQIEISDTSSEILNVDTDTQQQQQQQQQQSDKEKVEKMDRNTPLHYDLYTRLKTFEDFVEKQLQHTPSLHQQGSNNDNNDLTQKNCQMQNQIVASNYSTKDDLNVNKDPLKTMNQKATLVEQQQHQHVDKQHFAIDANVKDENDFDVAKMKNEENQKDHSDKSDAAIAVATDANHGEWKKFNAERLSRHVTRRNQYYYFKTCFKSATITVILLRRELGTPMSTSSIASPTSSDVAKEKFEVEVCIRNKNNMPQQKKGMWGNKKFILSKIMKKKSATTKVSNEHYVGDGNNVIGDNYDDDDNDNDDDDDVDQRMIALQCLNSCNTTTDLMQENNLLMLNNLFFNKNENSNIYNATTTKNTTTTTMTTTTIETIEKLNNTQFHMNFFYLLINNIHLSLSLNTNIIYYDNGLREFLFLLNCNNNNKQTLQENNNSNNNGKNKKARREQQHHHQLFYKYKQFYEKHMKRQYENENENEHEHQYQYESQLKMLSAPKERVIVDNENNTTNIKSSNNENENGNSNDNNNNDNSDNNNNNDDDQRSVKKINNNSNNNDNNSTKHEETKFEESIGKSNSNSNGDSNLFCSRSSKPNMLSILNSVSYMTPLSVDIKYEFEEKHLLCSDNKHKIITRTGTGVSVGVGLGFGFGDDDDNNNNNNNNKSSSNNSDNNVRINKSCAAATSKVYQIHVADGFCCCYSLCSVKYKNESSDTNVVLSKTIATRATIMNKTNVREENEINSSSSRSVNEKLMKEEEEKVTTTKVINKKKQPPQVPVRDPKTTLTTIAKLGTTTTTTTTATSTIKTQENMNTNQVNYDAKEENRKDKEQEQQAEEEEEEESNKQKATITVTRFNLQQATGVAVVSERRGEVEVEEEEGEEQEQELEKDETEVEGTKAKVNNFMMMTTTMTVPPPNEAAKDDANAWPHTKVTTQEQQQEQQKNYVEGEEGDKQDEESEDMNASNNENDNESKNTVKEKMKMKAEDEDEDDCDDDENDDDDDDGEGEDDEDIYQSIWKFKTLGEPREHYDDINIPEADVVDDDDDDDDDDDGDDYDNDNEIDIDHDDDNAKDKVTSTTKENDNQNRNRKTKDNKSIVNDHDRVNNECLMQTYDEADLKSDCGAIYYESLKAAGLAAAGARQKNLITSSSSSSGLLKRAVVSARESRIQAKASAAAADDDDDNGHDHDHDQGDWETDDEFMFATQLELVVDDEQSKEIIAKDHRHHQITTTKAKDNSNAMMMMMTTTPITSTTTATTTITTNDYDTLRSIKSNKSSMSSGSEGSTITNFGSSTATLASIGEEESNHLYASNGATSTSSSSSTTNAAIFTPLDHPHNRHSSLNVQGKRLTASAGNVMFAVQQTEKYRIVGIYFSLTDKNIRAIVYDYNSIRANDYFASRVAKLNAKARQTHHQQLRKAPPPPLPALQLSQLQSSSQDDEVNKLSIMPPPRPAPPIPVMRTKFESLNGQQMQHVNSNNDTDMLKEEMASALPPIPPPRTTSAQKKLTAVGESNASKSQQQQQQQHHYYGKRQLLPDSVQAWKFMLLDVNYVEDEEDTTVSTSEIKRAQQIKEDNEVQQSQQLNILQRFKSASIGNLTELPSSEDDKKSIAERMRSKLQRNVFKINMRSPKSEKKSRGGFFRRPEASSLYLEDGLKAKYPIFRTTLDAMDLNVTTQPNVPCFVIDVIEFIERPENITQDGIYRASGNKVAIDELKQKLCESYIYDPRWLQTDDIHTLTSLHKQFFRELNQPVIPQETYDCLGTNLTGDEAIDNMRIIFDEMPEPNRSTLRYLIKHLTNVAAESARNRMPASNLAIVWGPCLISSNQIIFDIGRMNMLAKVLIENYDRIFVPENERLVC